MGEKAQALPSEQEFIGISLALFKYFRAPLMFDIYVQRTQDKYTKLFNKGEEIDWDRAQSYSQKGVQSFFVRLADYNFYNLYVQKISKRHLEDNSKSIPTDERVNLIKELVLITMHDIHHRSKINGETIGNATVAVNNCIDFLNSDPNVLFRLVRLMSEHGHAFKHSICTSVMSLILAKADGFENATTLQHIGLGAFLHDVGMGMLEFDAEGSEHLTPQQWTLVRTHPELGKRALDAIPMLRTEVMDIVLQHHEQPNGKGYPNGLTSGEIFRPAKIVAIADAFSSLISTRPYRSSSLTPFEALKIIQSDTGKYDKKLIDLFIQALGIK